MNAAVVSFFIGIAVGIIIHSMLSYKEPSGKFYIDFTDQRKDLVKFELYDDLDEIAKHDKVIFDVDAKFESDFYGGPQNAKILETNNRNRFGRNHYDLYSNNRNDADPN